MFSPSILISVPEWSQIMRDNTVLMLVELHSFGCCVLTPCWGSKQLWDGHCWIYPSPARLLLSILHKTYFAALALVSVVETRGFALCSLGLGGYLLTETLLWLVNYNGEGWWQWTFCGTGVHHLLNTCLGVFPSGCWVVPWISLPTILLMISFCSPHWSMLPPFPTEQQSFT